MNNNPFRLTLDDGPERQEINRLFYQAIIDQDPLAIRRLIKEYAPQGAADTTSREAIWDAFDDVFFDGQTSILNLLHSTK